MLTLNFLDNVPDSFLVASARELNHTLQNPTLFDLPGRLCDPLFVSVLLHGNEDTGLSAIQDVLRRYRDRELPRQLLLFVGNANAASVALRRLEGQLDFNRAWPGTPYLDAPESRLMKEIMDYVAARRPFASIDIHNNTGVNPHYACINRLDAHFLHLARLFSRTVVFFEEPLGVQSAAMARLCPAVTIECGRAGDAHGILHAAEFIESCLALSGFPTHPPQPQDFDLMRTFAIVKLPPEVTFSFDGTEADIQFREDIDHLNFSEVEPGTLFGNRASDARFQLEFATNAEEERSEYFKFSDDEIRFAKGAIPAMLTAV